MPASSPVQPRATTPAKYPQMFAVAHALAINKLDLLPNVDYDVAKVRRDALAVNPRLRIFDLGCRTGQGLDAKCQWLLAFAKAGPKKRADR
jgi:hydrogenase nickel incorporation protein HypB